MDKKDLTVNLIIKCEGTRLRVYRDTKSIWTIGNGTTRYPNGIAVKEGDVCTVEQAKTYLLDHLNKYVFPVVDNLLADWMIDEVYAAICSLGYNVGAALTGKSIVSAVKNKSLEQLADAFRLYVKVEGKFSQGLKNRREIEINTFIKG